MKLSPRQSQVFDALKRGASNGDIAAQLSISEHTVKYHCRMLYKQFDVQNRFELMSILFRERKRSPAQPV
ncbi:helix-turn-helix transcriptional regulator [Salinispirillum sp. LH 10-3-1]|uniref:Helix-turn-helix transcriptional regulator n=1 Tax=Salinispirillum sp. LH 10-3-1 TaxID=2952525 RepID=A0AB38YDX2_9GAMM